MIRIETVCGGSEVNTLRPSFYLSWDDPTVTSPFFRIYDTYPDPLVTPDIWNSDPYADPELWPFPNSLNPAGRTIQFNVPYGILDNNKTYYVMLWTYFGGPPPKWSKVVPINISGALYDMYLSAGFPYRFDLNGKFVKGGYKTSEIITGCEKQKKKVFRFTTVPLTQEERDLLFNEFFMSDDGYGTTIGRFYFYDEYGVQNLVLWGDCERNIHGEAMFPKDPKFGITLMNQIAGAIRYQGEIVLTEI